MCARVDACVCLRAHVCAFASCQRVDRREHAGARACFRRIGRHNRLQNAIVQRFQTDPLIVATHNGGHDYETLKAEYGQHPAQAQSQLRWAVWLARLAHSW